MNIDFSSLLSNLIAPSSNNYSNNTDSTTDQLGQLIAGLLVSVLGSLAQDSFSSSNAGASEAEQSSNLGTSPLYENKPAAVANSTGNSSGIPNSVADIFKQNQQIAGSTFDFKGQDQNYLYSNRSADGDTYRNIDEMQARIEAWKKDIPAPTGDKEVYIKIRHPHADQDTWYFSRAEAIANGLDIELADKLYKQAEANNQVAHRDDAPTRTTEEALSLIGKIGEVKRDPNIDKPGHDFFEDSHLTDIAAYW